MKRVSGLPPLLAIAAVVATGCGGGGEESGGLRGTVTVFAAASLSDAFAELATDFKQQHPGVNVRLNFAGSATLRAQLLEGAPADLFASASPVEVEAIAAADLVLEQRPLATNELVIAAVSGNERISAFVDLAAPGLRLVLAAEEVPAGRYARAALALADSVGAFGPNFADRVLANVRSNETSVRAALAKVELGEADAAIVYASDLAAGAQNAAVRAIAIPAQFQVAVEYRIALLKDSESARAFMDFATSTEGAAVLARHGFDPLMVGT